MYEMRRKAEPTLFVIQEILKLPNHIGLVWEELAFGEAVWIHSGDKVHLSLLYSVASLLFHPNILAFRLEGMNSRGCRMVVGWYLELYILAISKIRPVWAPTCDTAHLWQQYSAAPLGNEPAATMTQYPTHVQYSATEPTSHSLLSVGLGRDRYKFV